MCRLLVATADAPFASAPFLAAFAEMAEASRSPDGDRQADGWGVAWLDRDGTWRRYRSLAPIWEDGAVSRAPTVVRAFAVHARSASFAADRGEIEHNQPYLLEEHAFVFNGLLSGVSLPGRRPGEVGSQRIATLLGALMRRRPTDAAFGALLEIVERRARRIPALDLAVVSADAIVAVSRFVANEDYYRLHQFDDGDLRIVCSQPLDARGWTPMPVGRPVVIASTARD